MLHGFLKYKFIEFFLYMYMYVLSDLVLIGLN